MNTYISLLRGINVGGNKKIPMEGLRALYKSLGFNNVQSYIQSGNVIFQSTESSRPKLIRILEEKIEKNYGFHVEIIIKTMKELKDAVANNPWKDVDEKSLMIAFLKDRPEKPDMEAIESVTTGGERAALVKDLLYLCYPHGSGRSKLSNALIEKKLNVVATCRNWNTTNKLIALAEASEKNLK